MCIFWTLTVTLWWMPSSPFGMQMPLESILVLLVRPVTLNDVQLPQRCQLEFAQPGVHKARHLCQLWSMSAKAFRSAASSAVFSKASAVWVASMFS